MAKEFKVRKGLIIHGSGSTLLDIQGSEGQLFSVTDSLTGSLFSVNDGSGIPIMEVFSDETINLGTFGAEAIKVIGSSSIASGSFSGSFVGNGSGLTGVSSIDTLQTITDNGATTTNCVTLGGFISSGSACISGSLTINSGNAESLFLVAKDTVGDNYIRFLDSNLANKGYVGYGGSSGDSLIINNQENAAVTFYTNNTARTVVCSDGLLTTNNGFTVSSGDTTLSGSLLITGSCFQFIGENGNIDYNGTTFCVESISVVNSTISRLSSTSLLYLRGSDNANSTQIRLYGDAHATQANDIEFTSGSTVVGCYDASETRWSWVGETVNSGSLTVSGSAEITGDTLTLSNATPEIHFGNSNNRIEYSGANLDFRSSGILRSYDTFQLQGGSCLQLQNATFDNTIRIFNSGSAGSGSLSIQSPAGTEVGSYDENTTTWDFSGPSGNFNYNGAVFSVEQLNLYNRVVGICDNSTCITLTGGADINSTYLQLYGRNHATLANDIEFVSGSTCVAKYDDSLSRWYFNNNTVAIEDSAIIRANAAGQLIIAGGNNSANGGRILLYGQTHSTFPGDVAFVGAVNGTVARYDDSESKWLFVSDTEITGSLTVTGTITAQEFHTEFVSASIIFESGSTKFGDTADDTHEFTGSVLVSGSITASFFSGDASGLTNVPASDYIKVNSFGTVASATGTDAVAIGENSNASGNNSTTIGVSTIASATNTFAAGAAACASGIGAFALGANSDATECDAFAAGLLAQSTATASFALGACARANNNCVIAIGKAAGCSTGTVSERSITIGTEANRGAINIGVDSITIGSAAWNTGICGIAVGSGSNVLGVAATAIGLGSYSNGLCSIAMGTQTCSTSVGSIAIGMCVQASTAGAIIMGAHTSAQNNNVADSLKLAWDGVDTLLLRKEVIAGTGDEVLQAYAPIVNKATSGNYTALEIDVTETSAPGTDNRLIDLKVGGTSKFYVSSSGDTRVTNNLTVDGTITAQEFHTEFVSASVIYESGSTKFGDTQDDKHTFTGSVDFSSSIVRFDDVTCLTGLGYGDTRKLCQSVAATTWSFTHSLADQFPVVNIYDTSDNIIVPDRITGLNNNVMEITFATATAGRAVAAVPGRAAEGSYRLYEQTSAATTWSFEHKLGVQYPPITVYDTNDEMVIPGKAIAVSTDTLELRFDTALAGVVTTTVGGGITDTASYSPAFRVDDSLLTGFSNPTTTSGSVVGELFTSSYQSAFFDYRMVSASNLRAGTVMSVWDGTTVEFIDTATGDIGDTSGVELFIDISGSYVRLLSNSTTDSWDIKTLIRAI